MYENQVVILDRGDYTTCAVNLHGATITSWRIRNKEQIFLSRMSHLSYLGRIRGGIGVAFPHYGQWAFGRQHGFARDLVWKLEKQPDYTKKGDVYAEFSLENDAYTESLWNFKFKLSYRVTLKEEELEIDVHLKNTSSHVPFEFNFMHRSMLRVSNVSKCKIIGLKGCLYRDRLDSTKHYREEDRSAVSITQRTDRVYKNSPSVLYLEDEGSGKVIKMTKSCLPDLNLWNPWVDQGKAIPDLGDDEYRYFLAPEAGVISSKLLLPPMGEWTSKQTFEVMEPLILCEHDCRNIYDHFEGYC